MSKWYGKVGYAITEEIEPGVWVDHIVERNYYGDVTSNYWKRESSDKVNDNINISNVISIVADPFAYNKCSNMVYVEYMDTKWKVTNIDVQRPRLILTVGGVWNGNTTRTSS